jgi:hypothetical protein
MEEIEIMMVVKLVVVAEQMEYLGHLLNDLSLQKL